LFFGDANPAQARVYARWRVGDQFSGDVERLTLAGQLVGPQCEFAQTLPARIPFVGGRSAGALTAEAVVPDPCFWTPELPFLYRAELELRHGAEKIGTCERLIGIRRLGVRGRWLSFEGKRFVLRGMRCDDWSEDSAAFARETWTAMVLADPSDEVCEFASRRGVLLVADLAEMKNGINAALRRMAQWPPVGIALLAGDAAFDAEDRDLAPNLLLAQWIAGGATFEIESWAQMAFVEVTSVEEFALVASKCKLPVVAVSRMKNLESVENSRADCDRLQRDLATSGDYAGYVV
jgi:hypothetical protein